jgi:hypothetical protein
MNEALKVLGRPHDRTALLSYGKAEAAVKKRWGFNLASVTPKREKRAAANRATFQKLLGIVCAGCRPEAGCRENRVQTGRIGGQSALASAGKNAFALSELARSLAGAADSFSLFAGTFFRRLFESPAGFHLTENAFALKLLLQDAEGLINIVITDEDLQVNS